MTLKIKGSLSLALFVLHSILQSFAGMVTIPMDESTISNVLVLDGIAEVTRELKVDSLTKGLHTLEITSLPSNLIEQSIKIKVIAVKDSNSPIQLLSTFVQRRAVEPSLEPAYIKLSNTLNALLDHYQALAEMHLQTVNRVELKMKTLQQYTDTITTTPSYTEVDSARVKMIDIEKMSELLLFQDKQTGAMNSELLAAHQKMNQTNTKISHLNSAVDNMKRMKYVPLPSDFCTDVDHELCKDLPTSKIIFVSFDTSSSYNDLYLDIFVPREDKGPVTFLLSYMVSPASWDPQYDLYLENFDPSSLDKQNLELSHLKYALNMNFFASVTQSTKENWEGVKLQLGTAKPLRNTQSPSPVSHTVKIFKPRLERMEAAPAMLFATASNSMPNKKRSSAPKTMLAGSSAFFDDDTSPDQMQEMDVEAGYVESKVSGDLAAAFVFSPEHPINISSLSSTRQHRILLANTRVPVSLVSYAVPTLQQTAYLKAYGVYSPVSNRGDIIPILDSHAARVFLQGAYSGQTAVPATSPGGNFRVSLGPEQNIKVRTTKVVPKRSSKEEDKSTWFVTDKQKYRVRTEEFAFTAKNTYYGSTPGDKGQRRLVIFAETIPQSEDDEVKVELQSPDPGKLQRLDKTGTVYNSEEFLQAVLAHPLVVAGQEKGASGAELVFAGGDQLIWVKWMEPGELWRTGFKYRMVWPDGNEISID